MSTDIDWEDVANLGRMAGIALFVVAFLLPGVYATPNDYAGYSCAGWTLNGTLMFFGGLFSGDRPNGFSFFFMISGWISPLVAVGIFIHKTRAGRVIATALPLLMLAPWIVFAWPESGWGTIVIRPLIGHYVWTVGCLLIFLPEYAAMIRRLLPERKESAGKLDRQD